VSELTKVDDMTERRFYWGKFKMVKGKAIKVWTKKPMTKKEMEEFDCTYRHMNREVS